jgi:hypothetical protein
MPRTGNERAHGPYPHGNRWRVIFVGAQGQREVVSFETYEEARKEVGEAKRQAGGRTVSDAVDAFLNHIADGVRERTLDTNRCRLTAFLRLPGADRQLCDLTGPYAKELYARGVLGREGVAQREPLRSSRAHR